ncbi:hypothetical protein [Croceicoccus bisphenolivorans]|uniref:hypothetical protein n=1 Tax=Croceicoccus bisphenolivorans TaxID=1783232 RepID=UPI0008357C11|nr:hypothetical protein [Croceicoccus bisphenolivorans]
MHEILGLEHDSPDHLIDLKYLEKIERLAVAPGDFDTAKAVELDALTTARSILKDPQLRAAAIAIEDHCNACSWLAQVGSPRAPALCFQTCPRIRLGLH